MGDWLPEEVMAFFAASPIGPQFEVGRVASDVDHPISRMLNQALACVPEAVLTAILADDSFLSQYGRLGEDERLSFAREEAVVKELFLRIHRRRRARLLSQFRIDRPPPYDEPELSDVVVSEDRLVRLSEFDVREGALIRNGRAYTILPPTPSPNSSYWITRALHDAGLGDAAWVRLDPLVRGPADQFPLASYRMLWWGPPLLWKDIEGIHSETFGRWVPGLLSNHSEFSDYAWVPRRDELHLFLEEMPKLSDLEVAGSRYFHVIFSTRAKRVIHLDGATRIYPANDWAHRTSVHVHKTGKVGFRAKVFRVDTPMKPDSVSSLGGTYFVWNYDVAHFFNASVPKWLLAGSA